MTTETAQQTQPLESITTEQPDLAGAILDGEVTFTRYSSDPPKYELLWPDVGGMQPVILYGDEILSSAAVTKAIFHRWKVLIPSMTAADWRDLLARLNDRRQDIDEPGSSLAGEILDLLSRWCENTSDVWSIGDLSNRPIRRGEDIYFTISAFENRALFSQSSRFYYQRYLVPRPKLYEILKEVGGRSVVKTFGQKTIRLWRIPGSFHDPKEQPDEDEPLGDF